jgi:hypothetical protein
VRWKLLPAGPVVIVSTRGAAVLRKRKAVSAMARQISTIAPTEITRPLPKKSLSRVQERSRRIFGESWAGAVLRGRRR